MDERAHSQEAGVFSRLASWGQYLIGDTYSAANKGLKGQVIADVAQRSGKSAFDTLVDTVVNDDLRTVLWPLPSDSDPKSWQLRAEGWDHPLVMIGGSDAGADLDRMCGAPYTTDFIGDCIRGRQLIPMEQAIHHLTDKPARLFGLKGRGRLAEGWAADVVIFDPETIGSEDIRFQLDLPGGAGRLNSIRRNDSEKSYPLRFRRSLSRFALSRQPFSISSRGRPSIWLVWQRIASTFVSRYGPISTW